jgi:hypothetical protein
MAYQTRLTNKSAHVMSRLLMLTIAMLVAMTHSAQAQTLNVLHNFTGGSGGSNPMAGLTMDRSGNLYGTTAGGSGTVFRVDIHRALSV